MYILGQNTLKPLSHFIRLSHFRLFRNWQKPNIPNSIILKIVVILYFIKSIHGIADLSNKNVHIFLFHIDHLLYSALKMPRCCCLFLPVKLSFYTFYVFLKSHVFHQWQRSCPRIYCPTLYTPVKFINDISARTLITKVLNESQRKS